MLEKNDILIITRATNGFMLTKDNDELVEEERELHVFNDRASLLNHLDTVLAGDIIDMPAIEA